MRHEKLIEKHLGINTPDWVKEKVNNAIDEALGYNLKKSEELTPYIKYHPNGNVRVKGQKNSKGQEEGIWEYFHDNGNIHWRIPYKEGKRDGIMEWFYENGNIKTRIPYVEGNKDGIQEEFDEQGNITETYLWKDGEVIEETKPELTPHIKYYSNRNVWVKGQLNSSGQQEGIWELFYPSGNIQWRIPYKGGKMNGIKELFYPSGNIQWRIPYVEGKRDGIEECFYETGNIIETTLWKDGELIETTEH